MTPTPRTNRRWVLDCRYDVRDPRVWYLLHGYDRNVRLPDGRLIKVRVPFDFAWDSASVPKIFQNVIAKWGRHSTASLLHDCLYVQKFTDRRTADAVFLQALQEDGIGWLKRRTMWLAVRLGGGRAWRT